MATRTRTLLAWSSGKDSAYALWTLRQDPTVEVVGLLTTLNSSVDRVSMHAVRRSVLEAQAEVAGLPLIAVPLPDPCSDEEYRAAMAKGLDEARDMGVEAIAFGDLFLPTCAPTERPSWPAPASPRSSPCGTGLRQRWPRR